ncbi:hypothetical protein R3P38DRAFT_3133460 [Favolaschia claudopus]|uniref:SH3 domain-containing protein n=1 Tax=Favolaschia claudopus TaxID=2862362 RepID=A0AAV9Z8M0_9AGAR
MAMKATVDHMAVTQVSPMSPNSHLFQNSSDFEIVGGQYVLGDVHNYHAGAHPLPSIPIPIDEEAFSDSEVYCGLMLRRKRGFPLYQPAPKSNLPTAYRENGVAIGDLGSITSEGIFDFYFNIFLPGDHPINGNRVPIGFVPLQPYDAIDISDLQYDAGSHISSATVERFAPQDTASIEFPGGQFRFHCSDSQGAVLALPHGPHLTKLENLENMREYAAQHAENWYEYVNSPRGRGRGLRNGTLYLITGCEKAQSWGMASYYASRSRFLLEFKPRQVGAVINQYLWSGAPGQTNPSSTKSHNKSADGSPMNHTTFVHGLSISLGKAPWSKILGTVMVETSSIADFLNSTGGSFVNSSAGASATSGSLSFLWTFFGGSSASGSKRHGDSESDLPVVLHDVPPPSGIKVFNPAQLINEYILHKVSDVNVVLSHDNDWADIIAEPDIATPSDFVRKIDNMYAIVKKDGTAALCSKNVPSQNAGDLELVPQDQSPAQKTLYCALYNYKALDSSELSFNENDVIEVLTEHPDGWWGGLLDGKSGYVPASHLTPLLNDKAEYTPNEVEHDNPTTSTQLKVMENIFKHDTEPNAALWTELATQLRMTARGVQVWCQNRRAKEKAKVAENTLKAPSMDSNSPLLRSSEDLDNSSPNKPPPEQVENIESSMVRAMGGLALSPLLPASKQFPFGTRVFFFNALGKTIYGTVQGSIGQPDGTICVALKTDQGTTVNLPSTTISAVV